MPDCWRPQPLTHDGSEDYDFSLNGMKHFMIGKVEAVYDVFLEKLKICSVAAPGREDRSEVLCVQCLKKCCATLRKGMRTWRILPASW